MAVVGYRVPATIAYAFTYAPSIPPNSEQEFWFIVGGPVSTWLVAAVGIGVILWKYRPMHSEQKPMGIGQATAFIASTFSLRFIFNAGGYFFLHTLLLNPSNADEVKIANYLNISPDLMMYGSALIGLLVVLIALYYVPSSQRYIVLISAFFGGVFGYLLWYNWLGPLVLPIPLS